MKLLHFYRSVLRDLCIQDPNEDGFLSINLGGHEDFVTVEGGKRLVLPTPELLREGKWEQRIPFHPLAENTLSGESLVIKALKDYIWFSVNQSLVEIFRSLGNIMSHPEKHKGLSDDCAQFLTEVPGATEKTWKAVREVCDALDKSVEKRLVTIYLKHGSTGKEGFARQAIVSFPIMDEFEHEEHKIFGVTMPRVKDKATIQALLEYILGDADAREQYSTGSNNLDAPYLHALLTSFYKLATRINQLITRHREILPESVHPYQLEWVTQLENFALYRGQIPMLPGNNGEQLPAAAKGLEGVASQVFHQPSAERGESRERAPDREGGRGMPWESDRRPPERRQPERPERRSGTGSLTDFFERVEGKRRQDETPDYERYWEDDRYDTKRHPWEGSSRNVRQSGRDSSRRPGGRGRI